MTAQLAGLDLDEVLEVVEYCAKAKYSEISSNKALDWFSNDVTRAKVIVELAAVADAGLRLCKTTCNLEGNAPLIFVAHDELLKLEASAVEDDIPYPHLEKAAEKALSIILPLLERREDAILEMQERLDIALEARLFVQENMLPNGCGLPRS